MDFGLNFRASSGYVTDPANTTYCINEAYPTTRGGFTFGVTSGTFNGRDRHSDLDARLAGMAFGDALVVVQLDLDAAGNKDIRIAIGDPSNDQVNQYVEILDNTTSLITLTPVFVGAGHWVDASGVDRNGDTTWASDNVAVTKNFATTTLILKFGGLVGFTCMAHLRVTDSASTGGGPIVGGGSLVHGSLVNGGRLVA